MFAGDEYARGFRETLWHRLLDWMGNLLARLWPTGDGPAALRWLAAGVLVLAVAAAVGRVGYLAWARREVERRGRGASAAGGMAGDPWTAAQAAAQAGRFADAAHLLYAALLDRLEFGGRVRLHPSKTAGDYVRELRRGAPGIATRFRDFTRAYERLAFGTAPAGDAEWERLHALALDVLGAHG